MAKVFNKNIDGKWVTIALNDVYIETAKRMALNEFIENKKKIDTVSEIQSKNGHPLTSDEKKVLLETLTTPYVYILEDIVTMMINNPEDFIIEKFDKINDQKEIDNLKNQIKEVASKLALEKKILEEKI